MEGGVNFVLGVVVGSAILRYKRWAWFAACFGIAYITVGNVYELWHLFHGPDPESLVGVLPRELRENMGAREPLDFLLFGIVLAIGCAQIALLAKLMSAPVRARFLRSDKAEMDGGDAA